MKNILIFYLILLFSHISNGQVIDDDVTQENIKETICSVDWLDKNKSVISTQTKISYSTCLPIIEQCSEDTIDCHISNLKNLRNEESACITAVAITHIIPIEIGGYNGAIRNMRPIRVSNIVFYNQLTQRTRKDICDGAISLKEAQYIFSLYQLF